MNRHISPTSTYHYLIHKDHERRIFYTNVAFLAEDFKRWGYRVDAYSCSSLWIKEHFKKPQRRRPLLLWAYEVLQRDEEREREADSVGSALADFIRGLVRCNTNQTHKHRAPYPHTLLCDEATIPVSTPKILPFYTSLTGPLRITRNAPKPRMAPYEVDHLDCLTLTIYSDTHRDRRKEDLFEAMKFVVEARLGRMAELRDPCGGGGAMNVWPMVVKLWVKGEEIDDERRTSLGSDAEMVEELPVYTRQEVGVEGERPPPYDEVVVREPEVT